MSVISLNKLKEISTKSKETYFLDLGKFIDKTLEGISLPIKVKSLEETMTIKSEYELNQDKLTVEYKPFMRMPKSFRDMYMKTDGYRKGSTENTYFQICKLSQDENKIEKNKYRERLFNILIHIDMDYILEDSKLSMWEDAGLKKGDYNGLVDLFSGIIKYEKHLDIFDLVIDKLKSGITDESLILASIFEYGVRKTIESIEDETERKLFIENYSNMIEQAQKNLNKEDNEEVENDK